MVVTSAEELLKRVNEGWRIYPDYRTGRWRISNGRKFEYIARELGDIAREIYVKQRGSSEAKEAGFGEVPGAVRAQERGSRWSAGTAEVLRALDEEYAAVIRSITEKARWFTDALVNIGWYSTMMAFHFAKVDPKDIPAKVSEFESSDNFVRFVVQNLSAMVEASTGSAKAIMEREKELQRYKNAAKVLAYIVVALRKQLRSLAAQLQVAHILISKYGLLEEYLSLASQYAMVESLMSFTPTQGGGGG